MKKKVILFFAALAVAASVAGQFPRGGVPEGDRPEGPPVRATAKEIAERRTEMMENELGLDAKQRKKVYKINLRQAEKQQQAAASQQRPSPNDGGSGGMGMGGQRGGGMPGGGMSGPGGGMGGRGGGMPGGGMGGQRGGGMPGGGMDMDGQRPEGTPRPMEGGAFYEESEKEIAARAKKMKKILDGEQFATWQKMEKEYRNKQMRENFNKTLAPPPGD